MVLPSFEMVAGGPDSMISMYPAVSVTFGEPVDHSPVALMVTPVLGFLALALAR